MHAEWLNAVDKDIISPWATIAIAWPVTYLILSHFAAGRCPCLGDPDVFSAAWEGNEKQAGKNACFTHSWAALAAAVSQRHPSSALGDVSNIRHAPLVPSSCSQGCVLCSGLVSQVHAFGRLLEIGSWQEWVLLHRQGCSQTCSENAVLFAGGRIVLWLLGIEFCLCLVCGTE